MCFRRDCSFQSSGTPSPKVLSIKISLARNVHFRHRFHCECLGLCLPKTSGYAGLATCRATGACRSWCIDLCRRHDRSNRDRLRLAVAQDSPKRCEGTGVNYRECRSEKHANSSKSIPATASALMQKIRRLSRCALACRSHSASVLGLGNRDLESMPVFCNTNPPSWTCPSGNMRSHRLCEGAIILRAGSWRLHGMSQLKPREGVTVGASCDVFESVSITWIQKMRLVQTATASSHERIKIPVSCRPR